MLESTLQRVTNRLFWCTVLGPLGCDLREGLVLVQWAFALPVTILRLPYSFVESLIWSAMLYWIIGFAPSAGR